LKLPHLELFIRRTTMRLYVNPKGQWVGTQAEAKKIGASIADVPTDKPGLLAFLNGRNQAPSEPAPAATVSTPLTKSKSQTLFEVAQEASLEELQHVVYRYLMKVDDALDLKKG
jgi:hypothetical protein